MVSVILDNLAAGVSRDELLRGYPSLQGLSIHDQRMAGQQTGKSPQSVGRKIAIG